MNIPLLIEPRPRTQLCLLYILMKRIHVYILCDEIAEMISYEIIAETDGATVLSGQSASVSLLTVPLGELECGEYSIVLTVDDKTYEGAFCIE